MAMPSSNSVAARHAPSAPATHATVDSRMSEIAIALREAVNTPGKTAALITPDRALARRVTAGEFTLYQTRQ